MDVFMMIVEIVVVMVWTVVMVEAEMVAVDQPAAVDGLGEGRGVVVGEVHLLHARPRAHGPLGPPIEVGAMGHRALQHQVRGGQQGAGQQSLYIINKLLTRLAPEPALSERYPSLMASEMV